MALEIEGYWRHQCPAVSDTGRWVQFYGSGQSAAGRKFYLYPAGSSTTGEETVCAAGKEYEQPQDPAIPVRERYQRGRHPALSEIGNPL